MGKRRGVLISEEQRIIAIDLIEAACKEGARSQAACDVIGITARTLQRWKKSGSMIDARSTVKKTSNNKLSEVE